MRKNTLLLSALTLSLGAALMTGCSGETEKENDKVQLELFSNKSESIETYETLIQKFEEANPTIDVELNTPPEAETVLKTRLTKNDLPDLMAIGGNATYGELANAGVLENFSDDTTIIEKSHDAYRDMITKLAGPDVEGEFGVPYAANANGIIYNKALLEELNLEVPKTWDEFVTALDTAKNAGVTPIYFTLKDAWTGMVTWNSLGANLVDGEFPTKKNNGEATFATEYSEVAEKFQTLLQYGHGDNFGVGYGDGNTAFANGESLFYLQGVWAIPEIQKANPEMEVGVSAFPASNDVSQNRLVSGVDVLLTMSADTEYPEEAKKFIEFMLNEENAKTYIDEQKAFSAVKNVFQEDPVMDGFKTNFEEGTITSFPDHYYPAGIQAANLVQEFLLDGDKEAFLKKMDEEWTKVLNR